MPPTELMKILSRADHIKKEFIDFLLNNNLASDVGDGHRYLNPLPYTLENILLNLDNILLKCYGVSFCEESTSLKNVDVGYANHININNINIYAGNKFHIYRPSPERLKIIQLLEGEEVTIIPINEITTIQIYDEYNENITSYLAERNWVASELRSVRVALISSGYNVLSILFYNPVVIECPNRKVCKFYTSSGNTLLLLPNESIISLIRMYYISRFITKSILKLNIEASLIEFLDYTTLSLPIAFNDNCIHLAIFNLLHRSVSSIVKSYKYIAKIVFDDITEYNYRHSVIRIGLSPYSKAEFKLCLHTL